MRSPTLIRCPLVGALGLFVFRISGERMIWRAVGEMAGWGLRRIA